MGSKDSYYLRIEGHIWRRIAAGFFVLIPIIATFVILRFLFTYMDGLIRGDGGIGSNLLKGTFLDFPGIGVIVTIFFLYVIGLIVAAQAGRKAINWQDALLSRIPVVKTIYGVARQATDSLSSVNNQNPSKVVFIEWPREGMKAIGFVTGTCSDPTGLEQELVVVYVPTVPNPTSGNLAFVARDKVVDSNLTMEDAMKTVFSGGMVLPSMPDRTNESEDTIS